VDACGVIIYVESNFVLEIARQQQESSEATALLEMAKAGTIELVVPVYAVCEPFSALARADVERNRFMDHAIEAQVRDLRRSPARAQVVASLEQVRAAMSQITHSDLDALRRVVGDVLDAAMVLNLDARGYAEALRLESSCNLTAGDAIILALVLGDARGRPGEEPKCMVNRDRDFGDPRVRAELRAAGCRSLGSFADAMAFIRGNQQ
jgi:hypothetical protein